MKNDKTINFMGVELTRSQIESYKAWLAQEEGKIHQKVVASLIETAKRQALKNPKEGTEWAFVCAEREFYRGESVGLTKVQNIPEALEEA